MRRIISVLLTASIGVGLCSCSVRTEDTIEVDIGLITCDDNSLEIVRDNLASWESEHPEYTVISRERVTDEDILSLAVMGADHLPDVFIANSQAGRLLESQGLVTELTGIASDVDSFNYDGGVYAFPVLRESVSVIVYDPSVWSEGDPVGYNSDARFTVPNCYLSNVLSDDAAVNWFEHMVAGDGQASFTDDVFVEGLDITRDLIRDDIAYGSDDELINAYVNGDCPAVTVYGNALFSLLNRLEEDNQDLYSRTGFATLTDGVVPMGYQYGVFVRTGMSEERTSECIDLARSLTEGTSSWNSDETTQRLVALMDNSKTVPLYSLYFVPWVWNYASDECFFVMREEEKTSLEYSFVLQNCYEMYYIEN